MPDLYPYALMMIAVLFFVLSAIGFLGRVDPARQPFNPEDWAIKYRYRLLAAMCIALGPCWLEHSYRMKRTEELLIKHQYSSALQELRRSPGWSVDRMQMLIANHAFEAGEYDVLIQAYGRSFEKQQVLSFADTLQKREKLEEAEKLYCSAIQTNGPVTQFLNSVEEVEDTRGRLTLLRLLAHISLTKNWRDCANEWIDVGALCALHHQKDAAAAAYYYGDRAIKVRHDIAVAAAAAEEEKRRSAFP